MTKSVVTESKHVLRNMVIAILTSVIGATVIYLLGFNNKKPRLSAAEREEATTNAWKSYAAIENIYIKNTESLLRDAIQVGEFEDLFRETTKESEKLQITLEDLIDREGIDNDLVSLFKKRLKEEKKDWPQTEKFYKELDGITALALKNNWTEQQSANAVKSRVMLFAEDLKEKFKRLAADIEVLSGMLTEEYGESFNKDDFLIIKALKFRNEIFNLNESPKKDSVHATGEETANTGKDAGGSNEPAKATKQYLTGSWEADGATITLSANGKFSWLISSENIEAKGLWQLKNNQVVLNIKKHPVTGKDATWIFNLSNVLTRSCTFIRTVAPFTTYELVRL